MFTTAPVRHIVAGHSHFYRESFAYKEVAIKSWIDKEILVI